VKIGGSDSLNRKDRRSLDRRRRRVRSSISRLIVGERLWKNSRGSVGVARKARYGSAGFSGKGRGLRSSALARNVEEETRENRKMAAALFNGSPMVNL